MPLPTQNKHALTCKQCGAEIEPEDIFCINCGTKICVDSQEEVKTEIKQESSDINNPISAPSEVKTGTNLDNPITENFAPSPTEDNLGVNWGSPDFNSFDPSYTEKNSPTVLLTPDFNSFDPSCTEKNSPTVLLTPDLVDPTTQKKTSLHKSWHLLLLANFVLILAIVLVFINIRENISSYEASPQLNYLFSPDDGKIPWLGRLFGISVDSSEPTQEDIFLAPISTPVNEQTLTAKNTDIPVGILYTAAAQTLVSSMAQAVESTAIPIDTQYTAAVQTRIDRIPTMLPTKTFLPVSTRTMAPSVTPRPISNAVFDDCGGHSRLQIGNYARVSPGEPNALRSSSANNISNVVGKVYAGGEVLILDGPQCVNGWVMWLVRSVEDPSLQGWTPETPDGKEQWLIKTRD